MPYEPLVLLRRLAPEDVNQLIRKNQPPPTIINQPQNAQTFQNNEGGNLQSSEKDAITNNVLPLDNQLQFNCSSSNLKVLTASINGVNHDKKHDEFQGETFSKEKKHENSTNDHSEINFVNKTKVALKNLGKKELVVVIDNSFQEVIRDMVNSTAQHPKTRNPPNTSGTTNSSTNTNNNSASSTRDSTKDHIIDDSIMIMNSKSPLSTINPVIEVIDKKNKDVSLIDQQYMNTEDPHQQIVYEKVQKDSSGLSLRTRTISSTTVFTPLHQSTVSTASVQPNCSTSATPSPRRRGRPPRQKSANRIANAKRLQVILNKRKEQRKKYNTKDNGDSSASNLHQQSIIQCNGIGNFDAKQENSNTNINLVESNIKNSTLLLDVDKNKKSCNEDLVSRKKSNSRKRKQSDIGELVAEKRFLTSDKHKKPLTVENNLTENLLQPVKQNSVINLVEYGFLAGYDIEPYRRRANVKLSSYTSICYGRTYWPTSWEYSAAALTGHIQKKISKDALRKIRSICDVGSTSKNNSASSSLKTNLNLKKYQTSVIQRRGSASKLSALAPVEISNGSKQHPSTSTPIIKRQKGRPPGRKNKLLHSMPKSNCPRKSPRKHASTLAIMSNKVLNTDKLDIPESDKLVDVESNKNSSDIDGPCILTMAVPNHERMPRVRQQIRRRQSDYQYSIIKRRRRYRSITPPPPKLCAQQPAPQRTSINSASVDQERVKLRTKHVDVVRRRARDERLRTAFVCQQLQRVQEISEQNRCELAREIIPAIDGNKSIYQYPSNAIILPIESNQDQIWSKISDGSREPDNMCLQIMYEQTSDKKFLSTNLTDETLQVFYQQRDLALAERLTNNYYVDSLSCDVGSDMIFASNKRKKKRPNMTGWPKEKRRKVITNTTITAEEVLNGDSDVERNNALKRRRAIAAKKQRLRRQRIKLEQQLAKEKSKIKGMTVDTPKRRGRRPGSFKKTKAVTYRRTTSVSSNVTTSSSNTSSTIKMKRKKLKVQKRRKKHVPIQNNKSDEVPVSVLNATPDIVVKKKCGRPKGSIGRRQRLKLQLLEQSIQNQTSEQQKENVDQLQNSSGKLKCVISTRNNRMKLLSASSSNPSATHSLKKTMTGSKTKKSAAVYNLSSSCLTSPSSSVTVVSKTTRTTKRKRLQRQMSPATWDIGRPKRYHSANHSRNAGNVAVEEDCCFVGSQPFEQHCPGGESGLSHNTVLEHQQDNQKENTVHAGGL